MKRNLILILSLLIVAACGGSSGGGSGSDDQTVTRSPNTPSAEPPPIGGDDGLDPDEPFDFGGNYTGDCIVQALGITSQSCAAAVNVYHDLNGVTIGFMGTVDVDMGITKVNYPVSAAPQDIVDGKIFDPETGEEIGEINYQGFVIEQGDDFMVFNRRVDGGFNFVGEYQDETYGLINIEGTLSPKE